MDKRSHPRVEVRASVALDLDTANQVPAVLKDFSHGGACVELPEDVKPEIGRSVTFVAGDVLVCPAQVVAITPLGTHLQFIR